MSINEYEAIEVEGLVDPDRGRRWYIHFTQYNPATMQYVGPAPLGQPPTVGPPRDPEPAFLAAPPPTSPCPIYPPLPHTPEQEQECLKFAHAMQALANAIEERRRSIEERRRAVVSPP
jgi:hypothetical protein